MKFLAMVLLTVGMGALGNEHAKRLTSHTRQLTELLLDALRIEKEMEWEAPTAAVLFHRLKSPVFQRAAEWMEKGIAPEEAMECAAKHLPKEEKEVLTDYASVLLQENPAAQVRGAKLLSERLMQMEIGAREKEKRLAGVYRLTGVLCGLFVSLLLL